VCPVSQPEEPGQVGDALAVEHDDVCCCCHHVLGRGGNRDANLQCMGGGKWDSQMKLATLKPSRRRINTATSIGGVEGLATPSCRCKLQQRAETGTSEGQLHFQLLLLPSCPWGWTQWQHQPAVKGAGKDSSGTAGGQQCESVGTAACRSGKLPGTSEKARTYWGHYVHGGWRQQQSQPFCLFTITCKRPYAPQSDDRHGREKFRGQHKRQPRVAVMTPYAPTCAADRAGASLMPFPAISRTMTAFKETTEGSHTKQGCCMLVPVLLPALVRR
jgi:hypothetical protein